MSGVCSGLLPALRVLIVVSIGEVQVLLRRGPKFHHPHQLQDEIEMIFGLSSLYREAFDGGDEQES